MPAKPRILHCCSTPEPLGGIWTYIRNIRDSRLSDRYDLDVCFYPGPSVGVSARAIRALAREMRGRSPDLIHLHGLLTEGFNCMVAARLGSRSPRLLTAHGFVEDRRFRSPWRQRIISRILEPLTVCGVDAVYAVSRYGANKPVIRRWARCSLGHVDNATPPRLPADPGAVREIRRRYGWAPSDVVAVCVSRFSREKGVLHLADAFDRTDSLPPNLRLLLVGDGPDGGPLQARLDESIRLGRAAICPAQSDVQPVLEAADLFVLPSFHENQSFAILEAMAAGLPVVSTAVGGTPEIVTHGESGLLVAPGDGAAILDAMRTLAADPLRRSRMGQAARQSVRQRHSFESFVDRMGAVYEGLLTRFPSRR